MSGDKLPVTQQQEPVRRRLNALVVRAAELRLLVSSSFACLYNVALDCSAATGREPPFLAVATLAVLFSHSSQVLLRCSLAVSLPTSLQCVNRTVYDEILNSCRRSDDFELPVLDIPNVKLPYPRYDVPSLEQEIS